MPAGAFLCCVCNKKREEVIKMSNININRNYQPIPSNFIPKNQRNEFDNNVETFYKDGRVDRSGDGVIDANEMRAILANPEKKARFLEALTVAITRLEDIAYKDLQALDDAKDLKAVYYDISSGKTARQLQEDLVSHETMKATMEDMAKILRKMPEISNLEEFAKALNLEEIK
jgi:hypothetical protein